MKIKTKSVLESLVDLAPSRDNSLIIESRGSHVIASVISLLENIEECYGEHIAQDLEKRLLSSIRNRNAGKFSRGIQMLNSSQRK